jgi:hypothetical protein
VTRRKPAAGALALTAAGQSNHLSRCCQLSVQSSCRWPTIQQPQSLQDTSKRFKIGGGPPRWSRVSQPGLALPPHRLGGWPRRRRALRVGSGQQ